MCESLRGVMSQSQEMTNQRLYNSCDPLASWSAFTVPGEKSSEGQQLFRVCCLIALFFLNHYALYNSDQQQKAGGNCLSRCSALLQVLPIKIFSSTDITGLESQHFLSCSWHCSFLAGLDIRFPQPLTTVSVKCWWNSGAWVPWPHRLASSL